MPKDQRPYTEEEMILIWAYRHWFDDDELGIEVTESSVGSFLKDLKTYAQWPDDEEIAFLEEFRRQRAKEEQP